MPIRGRLPSSVIDVWKEIEYKRIPDRDGFDIELDSAAGAVELAEDLPFGVGTPRSQEDFAVLRWSLVDECELLPVRLVVSEFVPARALHNPRPVILRHHIKVLLQADKDAIAPWNPSLLNRQHAFHAAEILV